MKDDEALMALGIFFIGLALLIFVGAVVALIYYIIVSIELEIRYQRYRNIARDHFDQVLYRAGYTDDVDRVFEALFPGIELGGSYTHPGYRTGILFGKEYIDDVDDIA